MAAAKVISVDAATAALSWATVFSNYFIFWLLNQERLWFTGVSFEFGEMHKPKLLTKHQLVEFYWRNSFAFNCSRSSFFIHVVMFAVNNGCYISLFDLFLNLNFLFLPPKHQFHLKWTCHVTRYKGQNHLAIISVFQR